MNRILILEDEPKAAAFLEKALSESGFRPDIFHSGKLALEALELHRFDLFILDVVVPDLNGIEVARRIHHLWPERPIIMLTARDTLQDRIAGIEAGASVYLVKPYSISEVLAYARTMLKKAPQVLAGKLSLSCRDLQVDPTRQLVSRSGKKIELTTKEFALLTLLLQRQGQVLTRSVIADEIWGLNFDPGTNFVDVHIRRLRSKIDDPFPKKLIKTIRGVGYTLDDSDD